MLLSSSSADAWFQIVFTFGAYLLGASLILGWVLFSWLRRRRVQSRGWLAPAAAALRGREAASDPPGIQFEIDGIPCYFSNWITQTGDLAGSIVDGRFGVGVFLEATSHKSNRLPTQFRGSRELGGIPGYRVVGTDREWAEGLFRSGLDAFLRDTLEWAPTPVRVQLTKHRVTIELEKRTIQDVPMILALSRVLGRLLRILRSYEPAGVEILEENQAPEGATCQVCGSSLGEASVRCEGCRTPHHKDCWEYLGRCSTFGCRSRTAS